MKTAKCLVLIVILIVSIIAFVPVVQAEGKVGNVEYSWDSLSVRQEEIGSITITFDNTGEDQVRILKVGIHLDWLGTDPDVFYTKDYSDDPIYLATGNSHSCTINFEVESSVNLGNHDYYLNIAYEEDDGLLGWSSETFKSVTKYDFQVLERDKDNDGVGDSDDAFPDDPGEQKDSDNCLLYTSPSPRD